MSRPIELVSGLLAATLGLIAAAYIHGATQSTYLQSVEGILSGVRGGVDEVEHGLIVGTIVLVGLGISAYLHSAFRIRGALIALWVCTVAFIVLALYAVAAIQPVWSVVWLVVPGWVMAAVILAGVLALISSVAGATPWMLARWMVDEEPAGDVQGEERLSAPRMDAPS